MRKNRVIVGLSGGVDSSVAALLLIEQGYEVHGVFMNNWADSYAPGYCTAAEDLQDARDVCETLDIPLHTVNFTQEYQERVFRYFLAEHRQGRTPNPDVLCNKEIKFKAFLEYARGLGATAIATGHYARCQAQGERRSLLKGVDSGKDQSYFLYTLGQEQLTEALFPVGELEKRQVREIAASADLVTQDKKDSTGICFIGERNFQEFLRHYLPAQPGEIRTLQGKTLGEHTGLMFYTLGQRQGLGIGGQRGNSGDPWYVVAKNLPENVLVVAQGQQHPQLFSQRLRASQLHWVAGELPATPLVCTAKTRYRQPDQGCTIERLSTTMCEVVFVEPQRAVTPGQSVVFYRGDECLGGGVIDVAFD